MVGGDLTGGGDKTPDVETRLSKTVREFDVYRVSHHGSQTSNNDNLLGTLKPNVSILSVGDGIDDMALKYKLPAEDILEKINNLENTKAIYMTSAPNQQLFDYKRLNKIVDHFSSKKEFNHVAILASKNSYCINGDLYSTDGHSYSFR